MANKIKPPKKFGRKPSAAVTAKRYEAEDRARRIPPRTGPVGIYLDDDRIPPQGWTLVNTVPALMEMIKSLEPGRLKSLSLDWDLGYGVQNGHDAVNEILDLMRSEPARFARMTSIYLHSDKREEALKMLHNLKTPLDDEWEGDFIYWVGLDKPKTLGETT